MFSIVIPLYNKQNSIQKTLESVLSQSCQDFEITIVDDGSTDKSSERVQKLLAIDTRVRYFQKENGGVCSARNEGINQSKYEYIAFLDADDIWEPTYLEEQQKLIHNFPDAAMWGINFAQVKGGKIEKLNTGLPENFRGYITDYFSMKRVSDLFCSSSVVVRKKAFDVVGFFDTRINYSEDQDMWYRIILNFPVVFYAKIMVFYLLDAENRALNKFRKLRDFLPYYIDKYEIYKYNKDFYRYIHRWSAIFIRTYYFNNKLERRDAIQASLKLDYSVIPIKYNLMFKTPYFIGKIIFYITTLKQEIFKT